MYYAGLDAANKSSFVYVIDRRGRKTESKEIPTDKDGIRQYFRKWKDKGIEVAVEAGGHARWIYDRLTKMGGQRVRGQSPEGQADRRDEEKDR